MTQSLKLRPLLLSLGQQSLLFQYGVEELWDQLPPRSPAPPRGRCRQEQGGEESRRQEMGSEASGRGCYVTWTALRPLQIRVLLHRGRRILGTCEERTDGEIQMRH